LVERLLYTQDVGGSSPSLPTILVRRRGRPMAEFAWKPMSTAPDFLPIENPVLFLASNYSANYDAEAKNHEIWMPVVGYGSKRDGYGDVLLSSGETGRREIRLRPVYWAEIPTPRPYPPRP
jgi:hypothetical protein